MNSLRALSVDAIPKTMKISLASTNNFGLNNDTTLPHYDATISTQWGFKVDENGYFGSDFNAAAGIPAGIKINQKSLETVEKSVNVLGLAQDPITALESAWKNFTKIAGTSLDPDGSMNVAQVLDMPNSFTIDSSIYGNVISVQQTLEESLTVEMHSSDIVTLSNGDFQTGFTTFFGMWKNSADEATGELTYQDVSCWRDIVKGIGIENDEGNIVPDEISVGNLFSAFIEMSGRFETKADAEYATKVEAYYDFTQKGQTIEDYTKSHFGQDFFNEVTKGYAILPDKSYHPELIDLMLQECNRQIQTDAQDYPRALAQNRPQKTVENPEVRNYIIYRDQTPRSGSLLSVSS